MVWQERELNVIKCPYSGAAVRIGNRCHAVGYNTTGDRLLGVIGRLHSVHFQIDVFVKWIGIRGWQIHVSDAVTVVVVAVYLPFR